MNSKDLIALTEQWSAHNYTPVEVVLVRGEGAWVWDVEGKKYLDLLTGYSAISFGHSNQRLLKAAHQQLDRLTLSSRAFYNDQLGPFCQELAELCGMEAVLPMTSGAEGVETAVKCARRWGYEKKKVPQDKAHIVCCGGNFHGRTTTIVGFSDSESSRKNFGPFAPGFELVKFGDEQALARAIKPETVAILFEPIQGEGGIIIPPEGYLMAIRKLCDQHNLLMIADEIQTGLCRTGKLFACDHENVKPDLYILGKGLGGGITPLSAVVGNRSVMDVFNPGSHGSTFGGNPLACAVGREVIRIIKEEKPDQRAFELGGFMVGELKKMIGKKVGAVRGRGLLIGIDIRPECGAANDFCKQLVKHGMLTKDTRKQTIRFAPSLFVDKADLEWAVKGLREVLAD